MHHLVAAFDKFRGTATAAEVTASAGRAARSSGWTCAEVPLADGGEGTLSAVQRALGGELRHAVARGPLGEPVEAEWLLLAGPVAAEWSLLAGPVAAAVGPLQLPAEEGPVAVIEAARTAGRALLPLPEGDDPVRATTAGVGDLLLDALAAGARQLVVAVGGTATTDGGWGAIEALGGLDRGRELFADLRVVVACDVSTRFAGAAATFGPQKGASPSQVAELRARLDGLAARYRADGGIDLDALEGAAGAGAGGGLAGGLAALGATIVPGFPLVAALAGLDRQLEGADLVVTGEGCLDATSFDGKVVGGVLTAAGGTVPALCIAGEVQPGAEAGWRGRAAAVDAVSLVQVVGLQQAFAATLDAVGEVVTTRCRRWEDGGRRTPAGRPSRAARTGGPTD